MTPLPLRRSLAGAALAAALATASLAPTTPLAPTAQAAPSPSVHGAIGAVYSHNAAVRTMLGVPTTGEKCGQTGGGCFQQFQHGRIYWSPATGAWPVRSASAIGRTWLAHPERYGYPVSAETSTGTQAVQKFSGTSLTWSAAAGTQPVTGRIRAGFESRQGIRGPLGVATAPEQDGAVPGVRTQSFANPPEQKRYTLVWSPRTGAQALDETSGIGHAWRSAGSERGPAGLPLGDERADARDGRVQIFQHGVWASTPAGAHFVSSNDFLASWTSTRSASGSWGYPVGEAHAVGDRTEQAFENGTAVRAADGAVRFVPKTTGAEQAHRMDAAAAQAGLGPALGGVTVDANGIAVRRHEQGVVVSSAAHGAAAMSPQVYDVWSKRFAMHGDALSSTRGADGTPSTRFESDTLAFRPEQGLVMRTQAPLTAHDALVIGDSQALLRGNVAPAERDAGGNTHLARAQTQWIERGLQQAGYEPVVYAWGGIGYLRDNAAKNGSYVQGVAENSWTLPVGDPGVVYVSGSGNDTGAGDAAIRDSATRTVATLRRIYPRSKIVMSGVVSQRVNSPYQQRRAAVDDLLAGVAREQGVAFVSTKYWITDHHAVGGLMADGLHFRDDAEDLLALPLCDALRTALRG